MGLLKSITEINRNKFKIFVLFFLKFFVLYAIGFAIIKYGGVSVYGVLCGFSILFFVLFISVLGIALRRSA